MLQVRAGYDQQRADFIYKQKPAEQMVGKGQFRIPKLYMAYSRLCITLRSWSKTMDGIWETRFQGISSKQGMTINVPLSIRLKPGWKRLVLHTLSGCYKLLFNVNHCSDRASWLATVTQMCILFRVEMLGLCNWFGKAGTVSRTWWRSCCCGSFPFV